MRRAGRSRRVRAAYDRLGARDRFNLPWQAAGPIDPPFGPCGGPIDHAEKAIDFNAGPNGPIGPIGSTGHGEKREPLESLSPGGWGEGTREKAVSSHMNSNFRLDQLDRLDQ